MAITIPDGPSARDTIGRHVSDLRGEGAAEPVGGAMPDVAKPLAVYVCGLKDLAADGLLKSAVRIGWRYLLAKGRPAPVGGAEPAGGTLSRDVAVADAVDKGNNGPTFTSLTHGPPAERLVQASAVAQSEFSAMPEDFEPRILEIPTLNTTALWLHAAGVDKFIPYLEGEATPSAPVVNDYFATKIQARAEAQMKNVAKMKPERDEGPEVEGNNG